MLKITSNEKAFMGGLVAALFTICVQLQQSGKLNAHEVLIALGGYAVTHFSIWLTTNTPKPVAPVQLAGQLPQ